MADRLLARIYEKYDQTTFSWWYFKVSKILTGKKHISRKSHGSRALQLERMQRIIFYCRQVGQMTHPRRF